jgi:RsiW-degrading membrane proteinase PrsW (M82 family)
VTKRPFIRVLVGSPLRRPLYGCIFFGALFLLLGLAFVGHLGIWISEPLPAITIFLTTSLLSVLFSLPALGLIWLLDRRERESPWLVASAVLWGAIISTGVSAIFNALGYGFISVGLEIAGGVDQETLSDLLTAALVAPFVEEAAKGIAVLVMLWFLRAEFDNLRDGLIYGALVGLGFNIAEVALYVMKGFIDTGVPPFGEQFAVRFVFLGINGHLLWAALCGAGIGIARQTANGCLRWFAPVGGYAVAVLGHMLNNSVGVFVLAILLVIMGYDISEGISVPWQAMWLAAAIMNVIVQGLSYLLLAALLYMSAQWERAIIRTFLADEVGIAVTPEEFEEIARDRPLIGTRRIQQTTGVRAHAIANAQNELAFRKWHLAREQGDPLTDPLIAAWRDDIARLRGSPAANSP